MIEKYTNLEIYREYIPIWIQYNLNMTATIATATWQQQQQTNNNNKYHKYIFETNFNY